MVDVPFDDTTEDIEHDHAVPADALEAFETIAWSEGVAKIGAEPNAPQS